MSDWTDLRDDLTGGQLTLSTGGLSLFGDGDFLTDIFGGGDITSENAPWGPLQPYMLENLEGLSQMAGGRQYFPGDAVADLTPEQLQSLQMMMGAAGGIGEYNVGLGEAMGSYMSPDFMDPNRNPYMQQYVEGAIRPITQQYQEQVLPGIRSGARITGGADYGSTRQGVAEGIAARGYQDVVGDVTSGIYTDLYGQNIEAQQRAMSMSPMYAQMMGMPASMYGAAGDVLQRQQQAEIGGEMAAYDYNRDIDWNEMSQLYGLASGTPYGTSTQEGAGPWAGIFGAGVMGLGAMTGNPMLAMGGASSMGGPDPWSVYGMGDEWDF